MRVRIRPVGKMMGIGKAVGAGSFLAAWLVMAGPMAAASMNVRELTLEYQPAPGGMHAVIHNRHGAAATAYIAEAYLETSEGERKTAFGGDSMGYPDGGGIEVAAGSVQTMNDRLPAGTGANSTGFSAAIYADGVTEGDEDIVAMMLSGRQRALADLKASLPALGRAARGEMTEADLTRFFEAMLSADRAEGAKLESMTARSGMHYRFFMTAVPEHALEEMRRPGEQAGRVLEQFRGWKTRLEQSRPSLN